MKNMKYGRESSIRMSRPLRAWSRGKHMELVVVCELWLRVMGSEDIGSCAMWHHFSSQAAQTQIEKKHMDFKTQTHCVLQSFRIVNHMM